MCSSGGFGGERCRHSIDRHGRNDWPRGVERERFAILCHHHVEMIGRRNVVARRVVVQRQGVMLDVDPRVPERRETACRRCRRQCLSCGPTDVVVSIGSGVAGGVDWLDGIDPLVGGVVSAVWRVVADEPSMALASVETTSGTVAHADTYVPPGRRPTASHPSVDARPATLLSTVQ